MYPLLDCVPYLAWYESHPFEDFYSLYRQYLPIFSCYSRLNLQKTEAVPFFQKSLPVNTQKSAAFRMMKSMSLNYKYYGPLGLTNITLYRN